MKTPRALGLAERRAKILAADADLPRVLCACGHCGRPLRQLVVAPNNEVWDDSENAQPLHARGVSIDNRLQSHDPETGGLGTHKAMIVRQVIQMADAAGERGWGVERIKWPCAAKCGQVIERRTDDLVADVVRWARSGVVTPLYLDGHGRPTTYNGYAPPRRERLR